MKINNVSCRIARAGDATWLAAVSRGLADKLGSETYPLRLSIVDAAPSEFSVETTTITFEDRDRHAGRFRNVALHRPLRKTIEVPPFVAVQIIPTGVRCEFGGFAGDACPVTNLLASCVD